MKTFLFNLTVLTVVVFLFQDALGQEGDPTGRVRAILKKVMAIQMDPQLKREEFREKRRVAIQEVIARNFDFDSMAKQALGRHWQSLEGTRQLEFKAIFQELFQDSYTRLVLDFLGREKVLYTKEETGHGRVWVKTTIARVNEEIPVDYSLVAVKERWLIDDVKIDGVSIIENYQKSFSRVIEQESYEGLLRKMRLQQKAIKK